MAASVCVFIRGRVGSALKFRTLAIASEFTVSRRFHILKLNNKSILKLE